MVNKYLFRLRRGIKDDTKNRDDWAAYETNEEYPKPFAGEMVLEYDNGVPRLKIGDGTSKFSELPYMSVDSFILPTPVSITLLPDKWRAVLNDDNEPTPDRYYQEVKVANAVVTPNSKIDLQPSPTDLAIFHKKDIAFTAINTGGNVRVCVIGQKPTQEYTIQATVTEVAVEMDEVIGNTTSTPFKKDEILKLIENFAYDCMIINSSTEGSDKKFKVTIDDDGKISAEEIIL